MRKEKNRSGAINGHKNPVPRLFSYLGADILSYPYNIADTSVIIFDAHIYNAAVYAPLDW